MGGILDFDAARLDALIERAGLKTAWLQILATHIKQWPQFTYILENSEFQNIETLDTDLLKNLTIGEIAVLYEYSQAKSDSNARKSAGQFYTPDDVAAFMASYAKQFPAGRWLDPCCGIGNLAWHLINQQANPEDFLRNQIMLSDIDELALFIARCLLTISFQQDQDRLFNEIEQNFKAVDFLNDRDLIPSHDFVIANPPYLALKSQDYRFETSRAADLYDYFLENIIKTSEGFITVTPQSFTNAAKFETLRALLLNKFNDLTIFVFDNIPGNIFKGIKFGSQNTNTANSMRAAITIAKPGAGTPRITGLTRWKTSERAEMLNRVESFLSATTLSKTYFPKVSAPFQDLYREIINNDTLATIIQPKPTQFALYIPAAPRYFITALKSPAQRESQRVVYFKDETDLNIAYMLINSSLMYWWWRVRDGGMTLAKETLHSLPIPQFETDYHLIAALQESEQNNKVYKLNAGAQQENVKHPPELIQRLNEAVIPKYADRLIKTHQNSDLWQLQPQTYTAKTPAKHYAGLMEGGITHQLWVGSYPLEGSANGALDGIWQVDVLPDGQFGTAEMAAQTPSPTFLALHPSGKSLYAVNEGEKGGVTAFTIGRDIADNDKLTLVNPVSVGSGGNSPCHIAATKDSIWVANYGDGMATQRPVQPENGLIEPRSLRKLAGFGHSTTPGRQDGPHAHFCLPVGDDVLVVDLGSDVIRHYPNKETDTGEQPVNPTGYPTDPRVAAKLPPGTGPRHAVVLPSGDLAVVGELDNNIHILKKTGRRNWEPFSAIPALKANLEVRNYPAHITLTGNLLIVTVRGCDVLATYRLVENADNPPTIEPLSVIELGKGAWPRHHSVIGNIENGRLLVVVANQKSNSLASVVVDPVTGEGDVIDHIEIPASPSCILPIN